MSPLPQLRSKFPPLFLILLSTAGFFILLVRVVHSFSPYSSTTKPVSIAMKSSSTSDERTSTIKWRPLGPSNFPSVLSSGDGFRYAKDDEYLEAVLNSWNQESSTTTTLSQERVETSSWIYHDDDGTPLYGHLIRPIASKDDPDGPPSTLRPGILLFHTAAGPQDVFLFQKAATLASSDLGCVVLICDVLSDQEGWAWTPDGDRTRFNNVKEELLRNNASLLRSRVKAAVRALADDVGLGVDPSRLASLGWCFGAQPILELAALQHQQDTDEAGKDGDALAFSATALVSYHGVYRRDPPLSVEPMDSHTETPTRDLAEREILICTGKSDPFVAPDDLEFARATMGEQNYAVRILEFDGAKHGFTNPAQDFNTNPAFQYNEHAASQSWEATMELLRRKL